MDEPETFEQARDALYGCDPEQFTERRAELVGAAKSRGDALAAKRIAALRRPTRAAAVLNRLVRADAGVAERLDGLAAQLATAQRSLDGARIRDASIERNRLTAQLTAQALAAAGVGSAPVALTDEIRNTLLAALADDTVRDDLRAGVLVRPARWDGFGGEPTLTLVPPTPIRRSAASPPTPARGLEPAQTPALTPARTPQRPPVSVASQRRARLTERLAQAQAELREAEAAAAAHQRAVTALEAELGAARRRADGLDLDVRMARRRRDSAQAAVEKLPE